MPLPNKRIPPDSQWDSCILFYMTFNEKSDMALVCHEIIDRRYQGLVTALYDILIKACAPALFVAGKDGDVGHCLGAGCGCEGMLLVSVEDVIQAEMLLYGIGDGVQTAVAVGNYCLLFAVLVYGNGGFYAVYLPEVAGRDVKDLA